MLTASCYSSQCCFTFFCSFSWRLTESVCSTNALPIAMHRQTRTLFLFTYAKIPHVCAPILHNYNTDVTDPQAFMPASAWHSCRDAALFPNYFGQTCYYCYYYKCQDLSDAVTTVAGHFTKFTNKMLHDSCLDDRLSFLYYQSAGNDVRCLSAK